MIDNVSIRLRFRSRSRDRRPILSAGSNQLHQDLEGVDRHGPLTGSRSTAMQMEQVNTVKK